MGFLRWREQNLQKKRSLFTSRHGVKTPGDWYLYQHCCENLKYRKIEADLTSIAHYMFAFFVGITTYCSCQMFQEGVSLLMQGFETRPFTLHRSACA